MGESGYTSEISGVARTPLKVLAVTPDYPPLSRVGAWLATHQFMAYMVTRGHEVAVLSKRWRRAAYALDGVVVEAGASGRGSTRPEWADVIVSHAGDKGSGHKIAVAYNKPSVRMVHGHHPGETAGDLLVYNSRTLLEAAAPTSPAIVCHPPVDRTQHEVAETGEAITIVNCTAVKGIKTLWRVSERLPDHRFLGVRGGWGNQLTPRPPNWEILPTQQDMRTVWAKTRVLAMPSESETWGMAGIEALCSGVPVVAHPTPGLQESLGDAGIFVDRDDTDGWVEAIRSLDDPDTYRQASQRARQRASALDPIPYLERFATAVEGLL